MRANQSGEAPKLKNKVPGPSWMATAELIERRSFLCHSKFNAYTAAGHIWTAAAPSTSLTRTPILFNIIVLKNE